MKEYHKIQTIFKRHREGEKKGKIIYGDWTKPEFHYLRNNDWIWTEKVDGTNIRVMFQDGNLTFGGKTDKAQMPSKLVQYLQNKFFPLLPEFRSHFIREGEFADVCFYGEGYGGKIQAGGKYNKEERFVLFDVKIGNWWLKREDVVKIGERYEIPVVPVVLVGNIYNAIDVVKNGFNSQWGDFTAEGLVGIPKVPFLERSGERVITKIKHIDFK